MELEALAALYRQLDVCTAHGIKLESRLRQLRRASGGLLEAVEALRAQWPPGSTEAEVVRGALAGRDEAVRVVLGH